MNSEHILARIRRLLLVISTAVFVMTVTELLFLSHWSETIQLVQFVLSGLGLVTLVLAYYRHNPMTINVLRWSMVLWW